jgi:hypothetical protein
MLRGRRATAPEPATAAAARPDHVDAGMFVGDVLDWFPATAAVFDRHGFALLRNPVARRTMARRVTVDAAARFRGVELGQLVEELAAAAGVRVEHRCEHEVCAGADSCRG